MPDRPAASAGLQRNDVVLALNGEKAENTRRFPGRVATLGPDANAKLTISRNGLEIDRKPVKSAAAFEELAYKAGDRILLLVLRDGQAFYLVLR